MTTNHLTIWQGSREFVTTTLMDESTQPATTVQSYDVAVLPIGTPITSAVWTPVATYASTKGVWVEPTTSAGTYGTFARVGGGSPNEQSIVLLGVFSVRNR